MCVCVLCARVQRCRSWSEKKSKKASEMAGAKPDSPTYTVTCIIHPRTREDEEDKQRPLPPFSFARTHELTIHHRARQPTKETPREREGGREGKKEKENESESERPHTLTLACSLSLSHTPYTSPLYPHHLARGVRQSTQERRRGCRADGK